MARTDIIVLGAGIVGTSVAVHLVKRGLAVALVDRGGPGEGTSYGNAGIIEGNTIFPAAFPSGWATLLRIALKRSPDGQLSCRVSAAGRAVAGGFPRRLAAGAAGRDRATSCGRCSRARSASTRHSPRKPAPSAICATPAGSSFTAAIAPSRRRRANSILRRARHRQCPARSRRGARARAVAGAGVSPRRALDRRGQRHQSAGVDARLCRALCRARRAVVHRRRAHAASRPIRIGGSKPRPGRSMPATS